MTGSIPVLYDGWSLAYQPGSSDALHLLTLLACLPEQVTATLVAPTELMETPSPHIRLVIEPSPDSQSAHLRWEQNSLPRLGSKLGARLIHIVGPHPPLFTSVPAVVSLSTGNPFARIQEDETGLSARLRDALGQGGMQRVHKLFWPTDIPPPLTVTTVTRLPPTLHPAFNPAKHLDSGTLNSLDLPSTYILAHGPLTTATQRRLLNAWSWAAGSIGADYPLVVAGLTPAQRHNFSQLANVYHLQDTVHILPELRVPALAAVYRACRAVFQPAVDSLWSGALRLGLASGKAVVAKDNPLANAIAGSAAYLASPGKQELRNLGAALISVVIDEELADALSRAAYQRSAAWFGAGFSRSLADAYLQMDS